MKKELENLLIRVIPLPPDSASSYFGCVEIKRSLQRPLYQATVLVQERLPTVEHTSRFELCRLARLHNTSMNIDRIANQRAGDYA